MGARAESAVCCMSSVECSVEDLHVSGHDARESGVTGEEVVLLGRRATWDGLSQWGIDGRRFLSVLRFLVRSECGAACGGRVRVEFGIEFVDKVGWFRWRVWGEWRKGYVGVSQCVAERRGCWSAEIVCA